MLLTPLFPTAERNRTPLVPLLLDLAAYFRRNLVQAGEFCTLKEELQHVRAYLALEQARWSQAKAGGRGTGAISSGETAPPDLRAPGGKCGQDGIALGPRGDRFLFRLTNRG